MFKMFIELMDSRFKLKRKVRLNFKEKRKLRSIIKNSSIFIKSLRDFIKSIQKSLNLRILKKNIPFKRWKLLIQKLCRLKPDLCTKNKEFFVWLRMFLGNF